MKRAMVDPNKCINCETCSVAEGCPQKAIIRETAGDKPWIDFYCCRGCMKCKPMCEHQSIVEITKPCTGGFAKSW